MAVRISDLFARQPAMRVFDGECSVHGLVQMTELEQLDGSMATRGCKRCAWDALNVAAEGSTVHQQARAQQQAERLTSALIRAGVTPRFASSTFENFHPRALGVADPEAAQHALDVCQAYGFGFREQFAEGRSLILSGNLGTGKTHLAVSIVKAVVADHARALITTAADIALIARGAMAKDARYTEREVLAYLGGLDLLIVDEIGCQRGSEFEMGTLHAIIDRRYQSVLPTVLISNLAPAELKNYIGERAIDRLRQNGGRAVGFTWSSMRATA